MKLTSNQLRRYSRHLLLPEVGVSGQEKLLNSRVLIVGLGGLGCPTAIYLAAAGIGKLGLVDFDVVDESNLQRQILYTTDDVGLSKVAVAAKKIKAMNSDIEVELFNERLTSKNSERIFENYDYIIDGTDNFATRYLVNDSCVLMKKINIYGSIYQFEGQSTIYADPAGPCYRCVFPIPPKPGEVPSCSEAGVIGILPGQIALTQAMETVKRILGIGESLVGNLMIYDALEMSWDKMKIIKNEDCPVCGKNPTITELIDYEAFCGIRKNKDIEECSKTFDEIKELIEKSPDEYLFLDVREAFEADIAEFANSINIPLNKLLLRVSELEKYKKKSIVVFCQHGIQSKTAISLLRINGFENLINIKNGLN